MDTIVFDKTGTLTKGEFKVTEIHLADGSVPAGNAIGVNTADADLSGEKLGLLELAALAESYSDHPISRSIKDAGQCH